METCYRISSAQIAHQNIDGEVIVIRFDTGSYFSLNGSAAELWQMLDRPQTVRSLCARFANSNEAAERTLQKFVDELSAEGLVERVTTSPARVENGAKLPFSAPVLEKYSDMQHLLLADPMHDVEEAGWPRLKA